MTHRYWCASIVTPRERDAGREPGPCDCADGTPLCPHTLALFPDFDPRLPVTKPPPPANQDPTAAS